MIKIAIHHTDNSYSNRWISYCKENNLPYKIVNCYNNDIISQLNDCSALMWHFHHASAKNCLFAKQLLYSVSKMGKHVFPIFDTVWHFDDKVGQKYLLEAIGAPLVPSYVFYSKADAVEWINSTTFPKVFKLRGGAGSVNVKLVRNRSHAKKLINKAFGSGFHHDSLVPFSDLYHKFLKGRTSFLTVLKGFLRQFKETEFAKVHGKEKGYIYFQDFIPNNDHDIRVIVIGDKAFAIKRMVRENDFRASGSGQILYEKKLFDDTTLRLSFEMAEKLQTQCVAFDFVYKDGKPLVVEISYGFSIAGYDDCPGYWDKDLKWFEGKFNPYGWMVENLIKNS